MCPPGGGTTRVGAPIAALWAIVRLLFFSRSRHPLRARAAAADDVCRLSAREPVPFSSAPPDTMHVCHLPANGMRAVVDICGRDELWIKHLVPIFMVGPRPVQYINVGANKGYNVPSILGMLGNASFSPADWYTQFKEYARKHGVAGMAKLPAHHGCGVCSQCREKVPKLAAFNMRMHAFEIMPANTDWLSAAFSHFAVPGVVVPKAVSNNIGVLKLKRPGTLGLETTKVASLGSQEISASGSDVASTAPITIPSTTLDIYMAEAGLDHVAFVAIDAEGSDWLVLQGLSGAFLRKAVDVVEFEYQWVALKHRGLQSSKVGRNLTTVMKFMESFEYNCFWVATTGCLHAASGRCWRDDFDCPSQWLGAGRARRNCVTGGNMVCAHGAAAEVLWRVATGCATKANAGSSRRITPPRRPP